jgi:adenylate cyclase
VNSGPALVGNFGGGRFFDYTAYGDTINIAARLEAANKQLGTRICVSGSVVERIAGFRGRPVGNVLLRGRSEPLAAHEPLTMERHADALTVEYSLRQGGRMRPGSSVFLRGVARARQWRRVGQLPFEAAADRRHRRRGRARMTMDDRCVT